MLHKFTAALHQFMSGSEFQRYLLNLQSRGTVGGPRLEEARRDYDGLIRRRYGMF